MCPWRCQSSSLSPDHVADGGDEGRTVDDLTASGANFRTRMFEKLDLPSLDDFVLMVMRVRCRGARRDGRGH